MSFSNDGFLCDDQFDKFVDFQYTDEPGNVPAATSAMNASPMLTTTGTGMVASPAVNFTGANPAAFSYPSYEGALPSPTSPQMMAAAYFNYYTSMPLFADPATAAAAMAAAVAMSSNSSSTSGTPLQTPMQTMFNPYAPTTPALPLPTTVKSEPTEPTMGNFSQSTTTINPAELPAFMPNQLIPNTPPADPSMKPSQMLLCPVGEAMTTKQREVSQVISPNPSPDCSPKLNPSRRNSRKKQPATASRPSGRRASRVLACDAAEAKLMKKIKSAALEDAKSKKQFKAQTVNLEKNIKTALKSKDKASLGMPVSRVMRAQRDQTSKALLKELTRLWHCAKKNGSKSPPPTIEDIRAMHADAKRQLRNRLSARLFRHRRKAYIFGLETTLADGKKKYAYARAQISKLEEDKNSLVRQLKELEKKCQLLALQQ